MIRVGLSPRGASSPGLLGRWPRPPAAPAWAAGAGVKVTRSRQELGVTVTRTRTVRYGAVPDSD
jgi:hypothetical protein